MIAGCCIVSFFVLFIFKYFNFFVDSINGLLLRPQMYLILFSQLLSSLTSFLRNFLRLLNLRMPHRRKLE